MATISKSAREAKERYWKKKYDEAPEVECGCGCGTVMKSVDMYGRPRVFISGHNGRKYNPLDTHAIQKAWIRRNRGWVNSKRQESSRRRKIMLMRRLGGKCAKCGLEYDGSNGASYHFHHTDPEMKLFGLGANLNNKSLEALKSEADKCQLLCANCHLIEHLGEW